MTLEQVIEQFGRKRVLVVGDVMLDRFAYGKVSRISPEAPVPVLNVERWEDVAGGAGNVALNVVALGASCDLIGVVGTDVAASTLMGLVSSSPLISAYFISSHERATTLKTRFVADQHSTHLLRADWEDSGQISADIESDLIKALAARIAHADSIIISDYNKGVVTQRLTHAIIRAAAARNIPVIVDPKGTNYTKYKGATAITPNVQEVGVAVGHPVKNAADTLTDAGHKLSQLIGGAQVLITRSEHGILLVDPSHPPYAMPARARRVVDVTGAGDTLVAAFALSLCCGSSSEISAQLANTAASLVVEKRGTAVTNADELRAIVLSRPLSSTKTRFHGDLESVANRTHQWRADGLTVGFTNGCFDLLHPGHIALLRGAREKCDRLIVGLNSDRSVRELKGPTRPVQDEAARATVLAALECVNAVILFDEQTPLAVIERLMPDVLFKGADYAVEEVVGRELVGSYGGRVELISLVPERSTTRTIAKIRASEQTTAPNKAQKMAVQIDS